MWSIVIGKSFLCFICRTETNIPCKMTATQDNQLENAESERLIIVFTVVVFIHACDVKQHVQHYYRLE